MGALSHLAHLSNTPPVGLQNPLDDAQTQTQATGAGGEEGREDAGLDVGGDARPGVYELNLEVGPPARQVRERLGLGWVGAAGADGERAAFGLERERVFDQFRKGPLQAAGVGQDGRQSRGLGPGSV